MSTFQGKHSSDEEDLNDVPDDDEYDTEDSFIDDTELVGIVICYLHVWVASLSLELQFVEVISNSILHLITMIVQCFDIFFLQDEYFQVDNSAIKHDGFFVNRGKLERMWVSPSHFLTLFGFVMISHFLFVLDIVSY